MLLDLTDDRGEFTSMALGDMGADVIKVEPPQGSTSRSMGPYMDDAPESERSLHYFAFNRNKRGVTLDLTSEAGRSALLSLAEKADFVVESAAPGEMDRLGVGFDAMKWANPKIVYWPSHPMGRTAPTPIWRPATLPSRQWADR